MVYMFQYDTDRNTKTHASARTQTQTHKHTNTHEQHSISLPLLPSQLQPCALGGHEAPQGRGQGCGIVGQRGNVLHKLRG